MLTESSLHSFIIKLWIESSTDDAQKPSWHAHITHVPSGERRYLKDLDGIAAFIAPYLEAMGVGLGLRWRLKRLLRRDPAKKKSDFLPKPR